MLGRLELKDPATLHVPPAPQKKKRTTFLFSPPPTKPGSGDIGQFLTHIY